MPKRKSCCEDPVLGDTLLNCTPRQIGKLMGIDWTDGHPYIAETCESCGESKEAQLMAACIMGDMHKPITIERKKKNKENKKKTKFPYYEN